MYYGLITNKVSLNFAPGKVITGNLLQLAPFAYALSGRDSLSGKNNDYFLASLEGMDR